MKKKKTIKRKSITTGPTITADQIRMSRLAMSVRLALIQLYPGFRQSMIR